jgi:ABC-type multidrug transport system ATPase subunit
VIAAALSDVWKAYGARVALSGLNLNIPMGSIYGLVGPNGVGKSTALRTLTGVVRPDRGRACLFEAPLDPATPSVRRRLSVLLDHQQFPRGVSVLDYLVLFARLFDVPAPERRAWELLERMGLRDAARSPARGLSRGQQQKLGMARALLHDADLYLWDEPVTGLDAYGIREARQLLSELRGRGKTVLFSSQILSEVERTADRVGILSGGRLIAEGTVADLQRGCGIGLHLEVELDQLKPAAVRQLQRLPFVRSVVSDGRVLHVHVDDEADHRAELVSAIMACGGLIVELRPRPASLEDLFILLTGAAPSTRDDHVAR